MELELFVNMFLVNCYNPCVLWLVLFVFLFFPFFFFLLNVLFWGGSFSFFLFGGGGCFLIFVQGV